MGEGEMFWSFVRGAIAGACVVIFFTFSYARQGVENEVAIDECQSKLARNHVCKIIAVPEERTQK